MNPNNTTYEDQGHGGHGHHAIVHVAEVVAAVGDDLEAKQRTATKELAEGTDDDQNHSVAKSVTDAIEERRPRLVLHGEGLEASHEDTVSDDQSDIDRELHADVVDESFQNLANDCDKSGNDHQLHHDADAVGDGVANGRDDDVGERRNHRHGQAHHDGRLQLAGDGKCRADAQYLDKYRVVEVQRIGESLLILFTK